MVFNVVGIFSLLILLFNTEVRAVTESSVKALVDDFSIDNGSPIGVASLLPSHCWNAAISLLGTPESVPEAATFCANLSMEWQKRLALELTRCYLKDVDRQVFVDSTIETRCASNQLVHSEKIHMCLRNLSDAAERAYSFYMPHIQTLCTRKTQELFIQYQQQKQEEMSNNYADIAGRSVEELESLQRLSVQYVTDMNSKLTDIPKIVEEQVSQRLHDTLREELGDKLHQRIDLILQTQASAQASFFDEVMKSLIDRETDNKQQYEDWAYYQSTLMLQQAKEMERQRDSLKLHRSQMEELSEKVSETSQNMQPLVGLQSLLKTATDGYAWLNFLLYLLASFNVVWVLTRPQMCNSFRPYIFAVVLAEAALEIALMMVVKYEFKDEFLTDVQRVEFVYECRRFAILLECMTYVVGMMCTFIAWQQNRRVVHYDQEVFGPGHRLPQPDPYEPIHREDPYQSRQLDLPSYVEPRRVSISRGGGGSYRRSGRHDGFTRVPSLRRMGEERYRAPVEYPESFSEEIDELPYEDRRPRQEQRTPGEVHIETTREDSGLDARRDMMHDPRASRRLAVVTPRPPMTPSAASWPPAAQEEGAACRQDDTTMSPRSRLRQDDTTMSPRSRPGKRPTDAPPEDEPPAKKAVH